MFPAHSIELKIAIAVCVLLPYIAIYFVYRRGELWPPKLERALLIFGLFVVSFILIALVRTGLWQYPSGTFPPEAFVSHAMFVAAIVFPGLPLLIILSFLGLLSWRSDARYLFLALSGLAHLFYVVNVMMFMADSDLIKI